MKSKYTKIAMAAFKECSKNEKLNEAFTEKYLFLVQSAGAVSRLTLRESGMTIGLHTVNYAAMLMGYALRLEEEKEEKLENELHK